MLIRYVGITLLTLGGAMLLVPDDRADDPAGAERAATRAPESTDEATANVASTLAEGAVRAAGAPRPPSPPAPAAASATREPSLEIRATSPGGPQTVLATPAVETAAQEQPMRSPGALDAAIDDAVAAAPLPSLSRPDTVSAPQSLTPETLALIAAAGVSEADDMEVSAAPDAQTLFVSGSRVNVRAGPATSYSVIDSLGYGESVELVANAGASWAEVRLPDARTGFMSRNFLASSLPGD